jgi:hypothetical protein
MKSRHFALLAILGLFLAVPAFADSVFVMSPTGTMKTEDRDSVHELLKISVTQTPGFTATENKAEADLILQSRILKLGDSLILNISKTNQQGKQLYADKMKGSDMSDMDRVSDRLVAAVLQEKPVADTMDVTNVVESEREQHTRRVEATRQWIIGLGPGWTSNLRSKGGGFTFALGYLWGLDPDFAVNLTWVINSGRGSADDSSYNDLSLGMEYFFSRERTSPFVGARMGYASAKPHGNCTISLFSDCDTTKSSGWGVNATAGMKFFRTSTVNLGVLASYHIVFDRINTGRPNLTTVMLVVYY